MWSGHGHFLDDYIEKANTVISIVYLENIKDHLISSLTITDRGCCTFSQVPDREYPVLAERITQEIYDRWWDFDNPRFPGNFFVGLRANQMYAWLDLKPRFSIDLRKRVGIEHYAPVDCEEISGTHRVAGGDGQHTICSNHTKDEDCERWQLVNPGKEPAYFESLGRSTCDGTEDLKP